MEREYDVIIVGGGVTGTALLYVLGLYSDVRRIALIEKNGALAEVNSHPLNNAQTSHDGGTETNYSLSHALDVQRAAKMLRRYVERRRAPGLFAKTSRIVLGVGADEVDLLARRWHEFKGHYPDLRHVTKAELRDIEPMVMQGRSDDVPVAALVSSEGYAINYKRLAECFVEDARRSATSPDIFFNTTVEDARKSSDGYVLETVKGTFNAKTVVFAAGAYSLHFAHMLGQGLHLGLLPISASFFITPSVLRGKVYRVPEEGMPFAAIHGDPDVTDSSITRFGPTTKPLPLMERHHYGTFFDFLKMPNVSWKGLRVLARIILKKNLFGYVLMNALYDLPVVGTYLFLREARKIVPSLRYRDISLRRGAGGIRPQIVNLDSGELEMGDKTIVGNGVIFNTTPSPGASVCLQNAERDAMRLMALMPEFHLDIERLRQDLGVADAAQSTV